MAFIVQIQRYRYQSCTRQQSTLVIMPIAPVVAISPKPARSVVDTRIPRLRQNYKYFNFKITLVVKASTVAGG